MRERARDLGGRVRGGRRSRRPAACLLSVSSHRPLVDAAASRANRAAAGDTPCCLSFLAADHFTVSFAVFDVALRLPLLTITSYFEPLSAAVTAGVV